MSMILSRPKPLGRDHQATPLSWVGMGRGAGLTLGPFPHAARRTGRATFTASGSLCVFPVGHPIAGAGFGVHGVVMFAPR
jgi:hypothetical protein